LSQKQNYVDSVGSGFNVIWVLVEVEGGWGRWGTVVVVVVMGMMELDSPGRDV